MVVLERGSINLKMVTQEEFPLDSKLRDHIDFVSLLSRQANSRKKRQHLLSIATPEQIDACSELFLNLLKGNIAVPEEELKKLERYKEQIRAIANKETSRRQKKVLLSKQSGGFLRLLLPAVAPLVFHALGGLFGK